VGVVVAEASVCRAASRSGFAASISRLVVPRSDNTRCGVRRPARHRFWARVVDRDSHDAEAPRGGENDDELRWQSYIFIIWTAVDLTAPEKKVK
jgi:hypothetical protein